jgi:hypothetical protein
MLRRALFMSLIVAMVLMLPAGLPAQSRPLAAAGTKAVVLFFVATDCPVSNRTFPEMRRLREEFAGQRVRFWFVYPNEGETAAAIAEHQKEFDAGGETWVDAKGELVALTHARVTPEVAVLVPAGAAWRRVYVGRVDDRYVRLGLQRPQATEHFAEQAIQAVLHGQPVPPATGTPVGCAIMNPQAPAVAAAMPGMMR